MIRAIHTILLVIFILLSACTDLGELGEEMSDARDAARPTVAPNSPIPTDASVQTDSLVIELAKPALGQAISGYPQISRAVQVLQSAEFSQLLQPNLEYTIFIPTDAAFAANSEIVGNALLTDIGPQSMWHYLIVPQPIMTSQFSNTSLATLHGSPLLINVANGVPGVANASIVLRDIEFDRGVVHIIDRTVLP